jgi:uncharacterized protein YdeI (BOF family)
MKKICIILLAISALPGFFSSIAQAAPYHHTTVNWIVANRNNLDVDDNYVTLVGHCTRSIGAEEYWFTDGTGSVRLDSENFDLPIGARIVVGGRIDQAYLGFGHLEVDVRRWHYAPLGKKVAASVRPPVTRPVQAAAAPTSAPAPAATTAPATTLAPPTETPASAPAASTTPPADQTATPATPAIDTTATNAVSAPTGK